MALPNGNILTSVAENYIYRHLPTYLCWHVCQQHLSQNIKFTEINYKNISHMIHWYNIEHQTQRKYFQRGRTRDVIQSKSLNYLVSFILTICYWFLLICKVTRCKCFFLVINVYVLIINEIGLISFTPGRLLNFFFFLFFLCYFFHLWLSLILFPLIWFLFWYLFIDLIYLICFKFFFVFFLWFIFFIDFCVIFKILFIFSQDVC